MNAKSLGPVLLAWWLCACGADRAQVPVSTGYVDVDDGQLYYEQSGDGLPVVLIHGGVMDLHAWDEQVPALTSDFRVIRYDLRGFGRSARPVAAFAAHRDLASLLDKLAVAEATLVGLSAGARIAIDFALENPERVRKLVLVGPGVSGYRGEWSEAAWVQELTAAIAEGDTIRAADAWLGSPAMRPAMERLELAPRIRAITYSNSGIFALGPNPEVPMDPPALGRLEEVGAPALVIVGDRDASELQAIADTIAVRVPRAEKVVMSGTGHLPQLEDPATFNRILLDFLRRE